MHLKNQVASKNIKMVLFERNSRVFFGGGVHFLPFKFSRIDPPRHTYFITNMYGRRIERYEYLYIQYIIYIYICIQPTNSSRSMRDHMYSVITGI